MRDEKIVAVGSREELQKYRGDATRVIDAGDGLVVPGLIDSHIHLIDGGLRLASVQLARCRLARGVRTPDRRVRENS